MMLLSGACDTEATANGLTVAVIAVFALFGMFMFIPFFCYGYYVL